MPPVGRRSDIPAREGMEGMSMLETPDATSEGRFRQSPLAGFPRFGGMLGPVFHRNQAASQEPNVCLNRHEAAEILKLLQAATRK